MSRVVVTDLVPGDEATSTDVNATISSWNTALAAGALGTANFRLEGLDRRTLSAANHAIMGFVQQYTAGTTGMVNSAAYVALCTSANLNPTAGGSIITRASVYYVGEDAYATNATVVTLAIQRSTDAGATWTTLNETEMIRSNKNVISARVTGNYYAFFEQAANAGLVQVMYRVAYKVTPGRASFINTTLVIEQLAR